MIATAVLPLFYLIYAVYLVSPTNARVINKRAAFYIANETMCIVDGEVFRNGDPVPTDDHCERCTCRPPGFSCVLRDCEVKPGCKAVRRDGECCPEYVCGCVHSGNIYEDGEIIRDIQNPCYTCRCHGSSISCVFADCLFRGDCAPEYVVGECCPRYDHCPPLSTTSVSTVFTTPFSRTPSPHDEAKNTFVTLTTLHLEKFTADNTSISIEDIQFSPSTISIESTTPDSTPLDDAKVTVKFSIETTTDTLIPETTGLISTITSWLSSLTEQASTTTLLPEIKSSQPTLQDSQPTVQGGEFTTEDEQATMHSSQTAGQDYESTTLDSETIVQDGESTTLDSQTTLQDNKEDEQATMHGSQTAGQDDESTTLDRETIVQDGESTTLDSQSTLQDNKTTIQDDESTIKETELSEISESGISILSTTGIPVTDETLTTIVASQPVSHTTSKAPYSPTEDSKLGMPATTLYSEETSEKTVKTEYVTSPLSESTSTRFTLHEDTQTPDMLSTSEEVTSEMSSDVSSMQEDKIIYDKAGSNDTHPEFLLTRSTSQGSDEKTTTEETTETVTTEKVATEKLATEKSTTEKSTNAVTTEKFTSKETLVDDQEVSTTLDETTMSKEQPTSTTEMKTVEYTTLKTSVSPQRPSPIASSTSSESFITSSDDKIMPRSTTLMETHDVSNTRTSSFTKLTQEETLPTTEKTSIDFSEIFTASYIKEEQKFAITNAPENKDISTLLTTMQSTSTEKLETENQTGDEKISETSQQTEFFTTKKSDDATENVETITKVLTPLDDERLQHSTETSNINDEEAFSLSSFMTPTTSSATEETAPNFSVDEILSPLQTQSTLIGTTNQTQTNQFSSDANIDASDITTAGIQHATELTTSGHTLGPRTTKRETAIDQTSLFKTTLDSISTSVPETSQPSTEGEKVFEHSTESPQLHEKESVQTDKTDVIMTEVKTEDVSTTTITSKNIQGEDFTVGLSSNTPFSTTNIDRTSTFSTSESVTEKVSVQTDKADVITSSVKIKDVSTTTITSENIQGEDFTVKTSSSTPFSTTTTIIDRTSTTSINESATEDTILLADEAIVDVLKLTSEAEAVTDSRISTFEKEILTSTLSQTIHAVDGYFITKKYGTTENQDENTSSSQKGETDGTTSHLQNVTSDFTTEADLGGPSTFVTSKPSEIKSTPNSQSILMSISTSGLVDETEAELSSTVINEGITLTSKSDNSDIDIFTTPRWVETIVTNISTTRGTPIGTMTTTTEESNPTIVSVVTETSLISSALTSFDKENLSLSTSEVEEIFPRATTNNVIKHITSTDTIDTTMNTETDSISIDLFTEEAINDKRSTIFSLEELPDTTLDSASVVKGKHSTNTEYSTILEEISPKTMSSQAILEIKKQETTIPKLATEETQTLTPSLNTGSSVLYDETNDEVTSDETMKLSATGIQESSVVSSEEGIATHKNFEANLKIKSTVLYADDTDKVTNSENYDIFNSIKTTTSKDNIVSTSSEDHSTYLKGVEESSITTINFEPSSNNGNNIEYFSPENDTSLDTDSSTRTSKRIDTTSTSPITTEMFSVQHRDLTTSAYPGIEELSKESNETRIDLQTKTTLSHNTEPNKGLYPEKTTDGDEMKVATNSDLPFITTTTNKNIISTATFIFPETESATILNLPHNMETTEKPELPDIAAATTFITSTGDHDITSTIQRETVTETTPEENSSLFSSSIADFMNRKHSTDTGKEADMKTTMTSQAENLQTEDSNVHLTTYRHTSSNIESGSKIPENQKTTANSNAVFDFGNLPMDEYDVRDYESPHETNVDDILDSINLDRLGESIIVELMKGNETITNSDKDETPKAPESETQNSNTTDQTAIPQEARDPLTFEFSEETSTAYNVDALGEQIDKIIEKEIINIYNETLDIKESDTTDLQSISNAWYGMVKNTESYTSPTAEKMDTSQIPTTAIEENIPIGENDEMLRDETQGINSSHFSETKVFNSKEESKEEAKFTTSLFKDNKVIATEQTTNGDSSTVDPDAKVATEKTLDPNTIVLKTTTEPVILQKTNNNSTSESPTEITNYEIKITTTENTEDVALTEIFNTTEMPLGTTDLINDAKNPIKLPTTAKDNPLTPENVSEMTVIDDRFPAETLTNFSEPNSEKSEFYVSAVVKEQWSKTADVVTHIPVNLDMNTNNAADTTLPQYTQTTSSPSKPTSDTVSEDQDTSFNDELIALVDEEFQEGPEKGGEWFEPTLGAGFKKDYEESSMPDVTAQYSTTSKLETVHQLTTTEQAVPLTFESIAHGPEKGGEWFEPTFPALLSYSENNNSKDSGEKTESSLASKTTQYEPTSSDTNQGLLKKETMVDMSSEIFTTSQNDTQYTSTLSDISTDDSTELSGEMTTSSEVNGFREPTIDKLLSPLPILRTQHDKNVLYPIFTIESLEKFLNSVKNTSPDKQSTDSENSTTFATEKSLVKSTDAPQSDNLESNSTTTFNEINSSQPTMENSNKLSKIYHILLSKDQASGFFVPSIKNAGDSLENDKFLEVPQNVPLIEGFAVKSGDFFAVTSSLIVVEPNEKKESTNETSSFNSTESPNSTEFHNSTKAQMNTDSTLMNSDENRTIRTASDSSSDSTKDVSLISRVSTIDSTTLDNQDSTTLDNQDSTTLDNQDSTTLDNQDSTTLDNQDSTNVVTENGQVRR